MSQRARKTAWLASLGASLEYYDFIIYGLMVAFLNPLFFSSGEPWLNQMKAFGVFAAGYLARPLGGLFFGMLGDAFGRKKSFLAVMILMAGSTLAIGLLPTREQIGNSAAILLILFRVLQGLSFGAELPGAVTVVHEHAAEKNRGLYSGFVISSVTLGSLLAPLILLILTSSLSMAEIQAWGWRIPFLIGGCLAIVIAFIRKYLQETPEFLRLASNRSGAIDWKTPLVQLLTRYGKQALCGVGMTLFLSSLVVFNLYLPTYLSDSFGLEPQEIYLAMTCSMAWAALILPLFGLLADRWSPGSLFRIATLGFAVCAFELFHLPAFGIVGVFAFMLLYQTALSCGVASYFPLLSRLFPTEVRYTGIALSYNVSYALMGLAPMALSALIQKFNPGVAIWFLMGCALLSALSFQAIKSKLRT